MNYRVVDGEYNQIDNTKLSLGNIIKNSISNFKNVFGFEKEVETKLPKELQEKGPVTKRLEEGYLESEKTKKGRKIPTNTIEIQQPEISKSPQTKNERKGFEIGD